MRLLCGFIILAYHASRALPKPITFDQRQTGDLNVHLQLKDVQVLALVDSEVLDDYTEYDYFYDYADFTIKPPHKPTTESTSTTPLETSTSLSSANSSTFAPEQTSSSKSEEAASPGASNSSTSGDSSTEASLSSTISDDFDKSNDTVNAEVNGNTAEKSTNEALESATILKGKKELRKRCRSGYSPNGNGRCRSINRRRLSLVPIAMKLAPRLFSDETPILPGSQDKN